MMRPTVTDCTLREITIIEKPNQYIVVAKPKLSRVARILKSSGWWNGEKRLNRKPPLKRNHCDGSTKKI